MYLEKRGKFFIGLEIILIYYLVDCKLSDWDEWSSCSKSCDKGSRSRNRTILVSPENEGQQCGSTFDIMDCNEDPCPGI